LKNPERNSQRILGIDPGSHVCGYGVISAGGEYIASGRLELSSQTPLPARLKELHEALGEVLEEFSPDVVAIEKIFFAKSVRSALSLGHARGVVMLAAALKGIPCCEYSPLEVKKAVTGYGRAEKRQVSEMVKSILSLNVSLSPDSGDALALAVCHLNRLNFEKAVVAGR
jgi:crossover junction endodeoxyribonuclease RuvC